MPCGLKNVCLDYACTVHLKNMSRSNVSPFLQLFFGESQVIALSQSADDGVDVILAGERRVCEVLVIFGILVSVQKDAIRPTHCAPSTTHLLVVAHH